MGRRSAKLLPLEISILETGVGLRHSGVSQFHGYAIAREIKARDAVRTLTAHGTLYKALSRMERAGMLESEWEDPDVAVGEGRPRRRLYTVTGRGERALYEQQMSAVEADLGFEGAV
jgi:DNA-binding PadR family transcriptional regulator